MEKIKTFTIKLIKKINEDEIFLTGAGLTYYFILSLFPFVIFTLSVISYTPLVSMDVLNEILAFVPSGASDVIILIVDELLLKRSETLLSLSILFSIYSGSAGITNLIKAIKKGYNVKNNDNFIKTKLIALIFTVILPLVMVITLLTIVFGEVILSYIKQDFLFELFVLLKSFIPFLILFVVFTALYKLSVSKVKIKFRYFAIGALFSTISFIVVSKFFGYYVNNFSKYSTTYGSLAGIIILLLWINLMNVIIVLGSIINGVLIEMDGKNE